VLPSAEEEKCVSRSHPCKIAARPETGKLDVFLMTIITIHRTLGNRNGNSAVRSTTQINDSIKRRPDTHAPLTMKACSIVFMLKEGDGGTGANS
jgi:hypothetical protein